LKYVLPFVKTICGFAIELHVIEAGVKSKATNSSSRLETIAEAILRAGYDRVARGGFVFCKGSGRNGSTAAQTN